MRLAPLLALVVLASAAHAQTDPNPPEAYAPLAVGNQWEYQEWNLSSGDKSYHRQTVVRDTAIAGTRWLVRRDQTFRFAARFPLLSDSETLVRFDSAMANVLVRNARGNVSPLYPCRLDVPLTGDENGTCGGGVVYSKRVEPVTIRDDGSVLRFQRAVGPVHLVAGRGLFFAMAEENRTDLVYALIDGTRYGTPVEGAGPIPDPTPPEDYYPLEVGNEWIYYDSIPIFNLERYSRRRIVREEVAAGQRYAVLEACSYDLKVPMPEWACGEETLLRFDSATASVFIFYPNINQEHVFICNLAADFGVDAPCRAQEGRFVRYADWGTGPVVIGGISYTVPHLKTPLTLADPGPPPFAAGIGQLEYEAVGPLSQSRFEYARVRGVEYGVRPVAGEAPPSASVFALAASPNPTLGPLAITVTLAEAQTVRLEAFDALGRSVWRTEAPLGAGPQRLAVDASAWAPGVYVVRATAGRTSASVRVVRR